MVDGPSCPWYSLERERERERRDFLVSHIFFSSPFTDLSKIRIVSFFMMANPTTHVFLRLRPSYMMRTLLFLSKVLVRLTCVSLFFVQVWEVIKDFLEEATNTRFGRSSRSRVRLFFNPHVRQDII